MNDVKWTTFSRLSQPLCVQPSSWNQGYLQIITRCSSEFIIISVYKLRLSTLNLVVRPCYDERPPSLRLLCGHSSGCDRVGVKVISGLLMVNWATQSPHLHRNGFHDEPRSPTPPVTRASSAIVIDTATMEGDLNVRQVTVSIATSVSVADTRVS